MDCSYKYCVIKEDGSLFFSNKHVCIYPASEKRIEDVNVSIADGVMTITGTEVVFKLLFGKLYLITPEVRKIFSPPYEQGYRTFWDRLKKKKTPYVTGWAEQTGRLPFEYKSSHWKLNIE